MAEPPQAARARPVAEFGIDGMARGTPTAEPLDALLRCPCELHSEIVIDRAAGEARCSHERCRLRGRVFPILDGQPILVDFTTSVLDEAATIDRHAPSPVPRRPAWQRPLGRLVFGDKPNARRNAARFIELLKNAAPRPTVLVIGGATIGDGAEPLYADPDVRIIAFDIYRSPLTDFIADAHSIPLPEAAVDGVWIQAVLEHVLSPDQVVAEISRILRPAGLVYAETAFMQQVHEGAFDFTRFTESGHRWLFRRFERIESGVERGPFAVLLWSIRYALIGLLRSRQAATAVCALLFWLRYLDHFVPEAYAIDGASDVYFLGRKAAVPLRPEQVIRSYAGAQR